MKFIKQKLIRIFADSVLINLSLVIAVVFRIFLTLLIWARHPENIAGDFSGQWANTLRTSLATYENSFLILTFICIVIFYLNGFYTHGRTYSGKFKALIIFQAVSLSYLIFAAVNYMFNPGNVFSRPMFIASWLVTLLFIEGSRLWSGLWRLLIKIEKKDKKHNGILRNGSNKGSVLVIGGAGFLGSILIRKLLKENYKVNVLDLFLYGDDSIRDLYVYEKNLKVFKGDFRSINTVVKAMEDMDAVVHLGAIVGDPACAIDPKLTFDINMMATKMVAEVAKGLGLGQFIFASSCSVYGASDEILNEKSSLNPLSLYAKTRLASEKVIQSMRDANFSPVILRFATLFGMSYRPRFDLVVNLFAARGIFEKKISIFGGDQWRPFLHVEDCAEAISRCLKTSLSIKDSILNIGSNSLNYRIDDIGLIVKAAIPDLELDICGEDFDKRNYRVNFQKMHNVLDFQPTKTIENGVEEIIKAIEDGLIKDYRLSKYNNYNFIQDDINAHIIKRNIIPRDVDELEDMVISSQLLKG